MRREYIATELCEHELGGIKEATFRRNKQKYLADLRVNNHLELGKRGSFITYILQSKKRKMTAEEKADSGFWISSAVKSEIKTLGCSSLY